MGLESATYISDLNSSNPTGTDPKSQGDDHIRLLKTTVKATFPNVTGAVTPTHTELNYVDGVTSAIQTQLDAKADTTGETYTGTHNFSGAAVSLGASATATTPATTDNSTSLATTAFVNSVAMNAALPAQTGNDGKFLKTDGANASWQIAGVDVPTIVSGTSQTAVAYGHYILTNTSTTTVTLPASPTAGDQIWVTNATSTVTHVLARNGSPIMSLAENLTIDKANVTIQLRYADATRGWVIV